VETEGEGAVTKVKERFISITDKKNPPRNSGDFTLIVELEGVELDFITNTLSIQ
jgi:hypothetical protein